MRKELNECADSTSTLFSKFRVLLYSSIMKQMAKEIAAGKMPAPMIAKLNKDNNIYVVPGKDRITLLYGLNFSQKTDVSLAKVFLQELKDAKRHVRNSIEAEYYPDWSRPPLELKDIEKNPKNFACGFISFSKFYFDMNLNLFQTNSNTIFNYSFRFVLEELQ